jgi:glycosyltransferase involved in cell wall biosynthesis
MEKKNVILRGPVLTQSGYGCHARQVAKWLLDLAEKRGDLNVVFEVLPWGITPWMVNPEAEGGLVGKILERCQKLPHYDVSLQLQLPNEWDPFLASFNIGITAGVETNKANPAWVDCLNRMDLVVVPSEFTKKTFMNSGEVTARVEVIPESWFEEMRTAGENNSLGEKLKLDTKFNFLLVGQFTGNNAENDRKNIAYTIKWIAEEFKDNPDVGLVIKTNSGRQSKADKRHCLNMLSQIVMQVKKGAGPKIYLLHGAMTNKEFADLYTHPQIKALVTLTHGEGFGLPILEAAVAGLPVIATDWSAHTEFLNQGKFIKVECSLGPIHQSRVDNSIFMPDAKWAFPNEQDFKRKIRRFYNSPAIPKTWSTELRTKLLNTHSPETISEKYTKLFEGII